MLEFSKAIKRQLREWMIEAYERELHRELTLVDQDFSQWREGQISSGELSYRVDQYNRGPSYRLSELYNDRGSLSYNVAYALVTGILNPDEVPQDVQEAIAPLIALYQKMKDEDDLYDPDARLRAPRRRRR